MKNLVFILSFCPTIIFGQIQGDGGIPISMEQNELFNSAKITFSEPDLKRLRYEDKQNDTKGNGPWRFGFNNETNLTLQNSGSWYHLENGGKIWLLEVECKNALTINLTLQNVLLPEGNELYVYNKSKSFILGKFTSNHLYEGNLGTELVPGNTIIVEYYSAPENNETSSSLEITKVTHGYRTSDEFIEKAFGSSGSCNMNVNCPDGLAWENQKRSVVMLVNSGGNGFCTGALINNTQNDGKPYILTANHCYSNPLSWVFRFNWEGPNCANPGVAPSFSSLSGSVLRARRTASDFCLVEITGGLESGTVPASYTSYFAGWDNTGEIPTSTVAIHHPRGDIKKISFDDAPSLPTQTTIGSILSESEGTWQVTWDRSTTTESASSGAPLFDQNHRIIGQLWGGQGSCASPNANDYFGRFSKSWKPIASDSSNQLKYWLDPTNINALIIDGFDPIITNTNALDAGIIISEGINSTYCSAQVTPKIRIVNLGTTTLTSATINYGFEGTENLSYSWTGNLIQYASEEIILPLETVSAGPHLFSATTTNPNGGTDNVAVNDNKTSSYYNIIGGESTILNLTLDCYASETSWKIVDENNITVYKSEGYIDNTEGLKTYNFCLAEECYSFELFDKYDDGLSGCATGNGSYVFENAASNTLAELLMADANFGASYIRPICLGTSALSELENNLSVTIYPNPVSEKLKVSSNAGIQNIQITDINGKEVIRSSFDSLLDTTVDVSKLEAGVYFTIITVNGKKEILKFIKQND